MTSAPTSVLAPAEDFQRDSELSARGHVAEIQRSRLLGAAVRAIDEDGYSDTTVARITNRARISRRTFYEQFEDREACLLEIFESALGLIEGEILAAGLDGLSWRERIRGGLWRILSFFDRDPALARVCVVQALHGGEQILERRAEVLARLASVLDRGRREDASGSDAPFLTAEGLVGAAYGIVHERLLARGGKPLTDLLAPLMGMIVLAYLGPAAARREQARPLPAAPVAIAAHDLREAPPARDPLANIPMRLTYRTALVLQCIAEHPGISNRQVGDRAGIADQGQTSKLLSRLERLGLAANHGEGHVKGEANAWSLTPTGVHVEQSIRAHTQGSMSQVQSQ